MKKILFLLKKIIKEHCAIGKNYSYIFAFYGLIWWTCFYLKSPFRFQVSSWAIKKKTHWLDRFFEKKYSHILKNFEDWSLIDNATLEQSNIWFFWGQGEENMPPLIKACYQQLTKYNNNVILVTNKNIEEYIHLSPVIYEKVKKGIFSWAFFSDVVRNTLLAEHGGLWLDSTVWVPGKIPFETLRTYPIYTANGKFSFNSRSMYFWTSGTLSWSGWCLWSNQKKHLLYSFVSKMLQTVAEDENTIPDYVIIDYFIYYAVRRFPSVAHAIKNCEQMPCQYKNDLALIMNEPYDESRYRDLCKDQMVFKLSFRSPWKKETDDGKQTFYGKILSGPFEIPE